MEVEEGRGQDMAVAVQHPLASCILYLGGGGGSPTLVTDLQCTARQPWRWPNLAS